jgi:hypothetical protein
MWEDLGAAPVVLDELHVNRLLDGLGEAQVGFREMVAGIDLETVRNGLPFK